MVFGKYIDSITTFIFLIFISNIKTKYKIDFIIKNIIAFFCAIELSFRFIFGEKISVFVLNSILETNILESRNMIGEYLASFIITCIPSFIIFTYCFHKIEIKKIKNRYLISLLILFILLTIAKRCLTEDRYIINLKENYMETISRNIHNRISFFVGDVSYIIASSLDNPKYSNTDIIEDFDDSIVSKSDGDENVILIIGESSLRDNYGIYGYNVNTTPNLSNLLKNSNSCLSKRPHSAAAVTRDSIAMTLSFHTPESEEKLFSKKSIIELAESNNYRTLWIGSQPLQGLYGSKFGFIAKKSNNIIMTNGNDDLIPDVLNTSLSETKNKNFIILHLIGSHIPYKNYDSNDIKSLGKIHNYDLTIHHTDKVIDNIINVLNKKLNNYVLIYTSDHGEEIDKGHGFLQGKSQYKIPFIIYQHGKTKEYCDNLFTFENEGKLSGLMNKYILSEMLGYSINKEYIEKEKLNDRILMSDGNVIKYDSLK